MSIQRAAIYARVSTFDQEPENQLAELRRYAAARGWDVREFVDHGVSGAKERRPALDALVADANGDGSMQLWSGDWIVSAGI